MKNTTANEEVKNEKTIEVDISQKTSKMLLLLAAPSIHDDYYANYFDKIVDFQVKYALKVIEHDTDNIRILVDVDTKKYYEKKLPDEVLILEKMYDIWMRDFTTVNPENPIQFVYTDASCR